MCIRDRVMPVSMVQPEDDKKEKVLEMTIEELDLSAVSYTHLREAASPGVSHHFPFSLLHAKTASATGFVM